MQLAEAAEVAKHEGLIGWVLTRWYARVQRQPGIDHEDLVAAGRLGVLLAVRTWRPDHGTAFFSFCAAIVRRHISEAIRTSQAVVVPRDAWGGDGSEALQQKVRAASMAAAQVPDRVDDCRGPAGLRGLVWRAYLVGDLTPEQRLGRIVALRCAGVCGACERAGATLGLQRETLARKAWQVYLRELASIGL